jgi:peptide methionine sulfoxide reductase MsrA
LIDLELLDIFFVIHDPTQEDGQGEDIGSQYLSGVFYLNETQKNQTIQKIEDLTKEGLKIATKVLPL